MTELFDFDDCITAPLNGFTGADDYYAQCSCRPFRNPIRTQTLILHAIDDPFMFSRRVPGTDELGPWIRLEVARHGGHVGFVGGALPWRPAYWLEARLVDFLSGQAGVG